MNKAKSLILVITTGLFVLSTTAASYSRQTGWIGSREWVKISRKLSKNGEYPVSFVCKDSSAVGLSMKSGLANVRIEKNTKNVKWHWAVGSRFAVVKPRLEKKGYKLVSFSKFRRARSNLLIKCGLWHKA